MYYKMSHWIYQVCKFIWKFLIKKKDSYEYFIKLEQSKFEINSFYFIRAKNFSFNLKLWKAQKQNPEFVVIL